MTKEAADKYVEKIKKDLKVSSVALITNDGKGGSVFVDWNENPEFLLKAIIRLGDSVVATIRDCPHKKPVSKKKKK